MFLGKVIGTVVCTEKDESLAGLKLLIVQPMKDEDTATTGKPIAVIDTIRVSGYGDLVYLAKSREAGIPLGLEFVAADAGIMGIVDNYNVIKHGGARS